MTNLATIIEDHDGNRAAILDGDTEISYGELRAQVGSLRHRLAAAGYGPDSRIGVMAGNETAFAVGILAALGVGGIAVPVRPTSPLPELQRKLASFDPDVLLLGEEGLWALPHQGDLVAPLLDLTATQPVAEADVPAIVDRDDSDTAFLMLTSGVSGDSKVAMLSHHNLSWMQQAISSNPETGVRADDRILGVLPFTHIFGLNVSLLTPLRLGALVVTQRRFDPEESLALIRQHQLTGVSGAPPMWQRWSVADAPDDSLSSLRHASSGAAALPFEVFTAIKDRFGIEIGEGYGLTETSPVVTWSRGNPIKPTSVGKPLEGVEVYLVEPDGMPVDPGDSGEIVVRGPGVFQGYLNAPDITASVLTPDGWFWTGDVGVLDDDGYLYLVDRIKDIIIVSGFNVYPSEVESILMDHPDVRGAVVVGTPHGETGEAIVAHVSGSASAEDLDEFCRARLSRYKCPSQYQFVEQLPVAPTGKLIRRELRS